MGLSMDAFAVAICAGLTMSKITIKKALIVGLYFGVSQAVMPIIGFFAANLFADRIADYSCWVAFVLLGFLGVKMIIDSLKKDGLSDRRHPIGARKNHVYSDDEKLRDEDSRDEDSRDEEQNLKPGKMLPLAVATGIDALAVGVSFAFLQVSIIPAASFIGIITLAVSMVGVKIGNLFGIKLKSKAQLAGGIVLVLIGLRILL
jgi:putative Mn2+ efflux pump MntP